MEFFVPYNMIEFFSSKRGVGSGTYRHINAQRIYLYFIHVKGGRIKKSDLFSKSYKEYQIFGISKRTFIKAINQLVNLKLAKEGNLYFTFKSKYDFYKNENSQESDLYSYKFEINDLVNPSVYKIKLFKYQLQNKALAKGKFKLNKKSSIVTNPTAENYEDLTQVKSTDFIQQGNCKKDNKLFNLNQPQAISYISLFVNNCPTTVKRKIKKLNNSELKAIKATVKNNSKKSQYLRDYSNYANGSELISGSKEQVQQLINHHKSILPILHKNSYVAFDKRCNTFVGFKGTINKFNCEDVFETTRVKFNLKHQAHPIFGYSENKSVKIKAKSNNINSQVESVIDFSIDNLPF